MQSERKIPFAKKDDVRRKSTNTFGNQNMGTDHDIASRFESFGKSKHIDVPKEETIEWQNQSFGDSDDNRIFESKRVVDINNENSNEELEAQNFSFCESDSKPQPRNSGNNNTDTLNRYNFDNGITDDLNLFSDVMTDDRINIEKILKRPTAVLIPSYIDTGSIISDSEVYVR